MPKNTYGEALHKASSTRERGQLFQNLRGFGKFSTLVDAEFKCTRRNGSKFITKRYGRRLYFKLSFWIRNQPELSLFNKNKIFNTIIFRAVSPVSRRAAGVEKVWGTGLKEKKHEYIYFLVNVNCTSN